MTDWQASVRAIMEEARQRAGSGPALSACLVQAGVSGEKGAPYSESAISNWIKGRAMPPGDVLLAAAGSAGISVDQKLAPPAESSSTRIVTHEDLDALYTALGSSYAADIARKWAEPLPEVETGTQYSRHESDALWVHCCGDEIHGGATHSRLTIDWVGPWVPVDPKEAQ